MENQKVCIKSGTRDLLRIIPFPAKNEYDFKISVINNDFKLRMHPEYSEKFYMPPNEFDLKNWEITYHNSDDRNPAKIHLKSLTLPPNYIKLPISNFANPKKTAFFPIPFLKIGFSFSDYFKVYNPKPNYEVIDLEKNNVVEVFIVPANFDLKQFISKWALFDLIYTMVPMEYFVNGKLRAFSKAKYKAIYNDGSCFRKLFKINKEIALLCNFYRDDAVDGSKQESYISIYENGNYFKYLFLAPVNYYYTNGEISQKQIVYRRQLEMITRWASREEYLYWEDYFNQIHKQFEDCKLDGFSLQGD